MPYASNAELPPAVRKHLPSHGQRIWRKAHNAAMSQYEGSEEKSAAVAWAAVKHKYEKSATGKWVAKKDEAMRKRDQDGTIGNINHQLPWSTDVPGGGYPASCSPGDACTIDGRPGTLRARGGDLICVPTDAVPSDPRIMATSAGGGAGANGPRIMETSVGKGYGANVPPGNRTMQVGRGDALTVPAGTYPLGAYPEGMECVLGDGKIGRLVKEDTMLVCRAFQRSPDHDQATVDDAEEDWVGDREFTAAMREEAVKRGAAMRGGGYPIENEEDLHDAMRALGRAKNRSATIAHIKKRAKALGVSLPEDWPNDSKDGATLFDHELSRDGEHWKVNDIIVLDRKSVHMRSDGYMAARPRVARAGIQLYRGSELGDLRQVVRVYRPPQQVFNRDSFSSFSSRPITNDHPPVMVDSSNWKTYAVGYTGEDIVRDGEFIRVPMTVCDAQTVREFQEGKRELSVGYSCDLDFTPGATVDGDEYDCSQKDIRVNHVAFVTRARGGDKLTFGDATQTGGNSMNLRTVTIDGLEVQVPAYAADIILKALSAKDAVIAKYKRDQEEDDDEDEEEDKKNKKRKEEDAATIATLTKQVADLKGQVSPEALNARISELADTRAKTVALIGEHPNLATMPVADMRRLVVTTKMGDAAAKWSDDAIAASFATLTASPPNGAGWQDTAKFISGGLRDGYTPRPGFQDSRTAMSPQDKAYYEMVDGLANQWRGENWGKDQVAR